MATQNIQKRKTRSKLKIENLGHLAVNFRNVEEDDDRRDKKGMYLVHRF